LQKNLNFEVSKIFVNMTSNKKQKKMANIKTTKGIIAILTGGGGCPGT